MKKEPIKIPYAVAHFVKMQKEGYYFVDKTKYIAELEKYTAPVFLRPRRFGKSLYCSILENYYDIKQADEFNALFGNTWIGQNPTGKQNSYITLRFNFSVIPLGNSIEDLAKNFANILSPSFKYTAEKYGEYLEGLEYTDKSDPSTQLSNLIDYLRFHSDKPRLYIIIDEYDNFTNQLITSGLDSFYNEVIAKDSFFKTFFKVIKDGLGNGSIAGFYMTGVLPITIDDLTSGFNVAELISFEPSFANMLGFTQSETEDYLNAVFDSYGFDKTDLPAIKQIIRNNYDGYKFLPNAEPIYNSTIVTYFFSNYARQNAYVPEVLIDENLRTDINWIKRLTNGVETAKLMLNDFMHNKTLSYDHTKLTSKFGKEKLFTKEYYPISLFYLGMTTLVDKYYMQLPNLTMKSIFIDYYNVINKLEGIPDRYVGYFKNFIETEDIRFLFEAYFNEYLSQFVAQSFDKMNENFVRNTFYELSCRYLIGQYIIGMEQNYPSGRADLEVTGIPGTPSQKLKHIIELKYFTAKEWKRIKDLAVPHSEDAEQVKQYARDAQNIFPDFKIRQYVAYIVSNKGWKLWEC